MYNIFRLFFPLSVVWAWSPPSPPHCQNKKWTMTTAPTDMTYLDTLRERQWQTRPVGRSRRVRRHDDRQTRSRRRRMETSSLLRETVFDDPMASRSRRSPPLPPINTSSSSFPLVLNNTFVIHQFSPHAVTDLKKFFTVRSDTTTTPSSSVRRSKISSSGQFRLQNVTLAYNFSHIGGYTAIKTDLYQILDMVRHPLKYFQYNVRIPRGVLLHGPPGNGKTLFARCFAGESKLPIIATSGSEFQEKYVGTGPARIRELFEFAREQAPCILFIDEIDAVARRRGTDQEAAQAERDSTLNQLLVELDGFEDHRNESQFVFVIASTNRLDILDPALLRPGRMDKKIRVPLPDATTRRAIINIHRQGKPLDVSLEWLVYDMTEGCSGAEIEHLLNEATLAGIRKNQLPVCQQLVEETAESILLGGHVDMTLPSTERDTLRGELERVAIHEVGHALMAFLCTHHPPPKKCSLRNCPSMNMLGFTLFPRPIQQKLMTLQELEDRIKVLLAGRIAEELLLGDASTGAAEDLRQCHELAHALVVRFGMGIRLYPLTSQTSMSDSLKQSIEEDVANLLARQYSAVQSSLSMYQDLLTTWSQRLLESRELHFEDLVLDIPETVRCQRKEPYQF